MNSQVKIGTEIRQLHLNQISSLPVTASQIRKSTATDPLLSRVVQNLRYGWSEQKDPSLQPYRQRASELTLEDNCVLWGVRVVIPTKLREAVLQELHACHPGISKMKAIARSHVWWPGIDAEIESTVKACVPCQQQKNVEVKVPLMPWWWPASVGERIHADFAELKGQQFLIVIDAYSKWPEIKPMTRITSQATINQLRTIFSTWGLPRELVTDNGPAFVSSEFADFCQRNGIRHVRVTPFHPRSNGEAERMVRTFKRTMKSMIKDGDSVLEKLPRLLLSYRSTPHAVTSRTPAELFMGRQLRTRLDLMHPSTLRRVEHHQDQQKFHYHRKARETEFEPGADVWTRNYRVGEDRWQRGAVTHRTGPASYRVNTANGEIRRHADQMRPAASGSNDLRPLEDQPEEPGPPQQPTLHPNEPTEAQLELRRSTRTRHPPSRFSYSKLGGDNVAT